MASEITEEEDEEALCIIDTEAKRDKIRRIIDYQKSMYLSSSSSSSAAASCSSFSSSRRSSSLLDLMKEGSTSLRRLFDMEHTSLGTYFKDYSGSPIIKPILLWGSDSDDGIHDDPWMDIKQIGPVACSGARGLTGLASDGSSMVEESAYENRKASMRTRKLTRKKSFRRLPRFYKWRFRGSRFRFRLRRLKIMICGRKL
ncbi:hypothetical protein RJ639_016928 [Escallonia herrerae]|uniref:Uncharacterized protein n=1 Tax=Escallonia herrerae TaxID=1293975 RepID=A0AA88VBE7_9ASTE|nr:hypothetical protein RJ639_016928 [Escallonia herrerae]